MIMNLIPFKPVWQGPGAACPTGTIFPAAATENTPVIIAEDDAVSKAMLTAVLRRAGFDPIVTSNGAEAMTALRRQTKACVVLVDWMMPEMDGAEVCRRISESSKLAHVIMLTSRTNKEYAVTALDCGADDYLVKPFDNSELIARIRAGIRNLDAQAALGERVRELEDAAVESQRTPHMLI